MKLRILSLIGLAILLSACTGALPFPLGTSTIPTASLAVPPTPAPTETPTVTPEPTATATPTPLPQARIANGDEWIRLGDYERAVQEFQAALDDPGAQEAAPAAWLGIGQVNYITGDYPSALDSLRRVIENYPETPEAGLAQYHLARTYSALDRHSEAAEAYGAYLALRPGQLDAYIYELRGDALAAAGDPAGAIIEYEAAAAAPRLGSADRPVLKIAQNLFTLEEYDAVIQRLTALYDTTGDDYTKASADLLLGQSYLAIDDTENAHARFLDAVSNYPRSYDSYLALVNLVDAGVPVDDFERGLVDYFAGQYGAAIDAFDRAILNDPDHSGEPHYYKGLALLESNRPEDAIAEWDEVILTHPGDRNSTTAWEEKAYTQWAYLGLYPESAQTLLAFVTQSPEHPQAADFLFQAARSLERNGQLEEAALTWQRVADEYTTSDLSFRSLLLSGVSRVRQGNWSQAKPIFQRALVLSSDPFDQAAAGLWVGKAQAAENNLDGARLTWQQAYEKDPTGYYSERARDLLLDRAPFTPPAFYDLGYDLEAERLEAETWMRQQFSLAPETNLLDPGQLNSDPRMIRAMEFWRLGQWGRARDEFESLRQDTSADAVAQFRQTLLYHRLGLYRSAILSSRQVLSLAGMDDAATLNAPIFFNHIRFGPYYRQLVAPSAEEEELHPLLLFSVIRQESMFEGFATSSANARGLMQVIPSTGQSVAENLGWPPDFSPDDLYRPVVSLRIGSRYLAQQRSAFDGDMFAALAAYNGGPGNAAIWKELAPSDPDLYLETVRLSETRSYIMRIYELFNIYRRLYERSP